jgi:hypothetical protein
MQVDQLVKLSALERKRLVLHLRTWIHVGFLFSPESVSCRPNSMRIHIPQHLDTAEFSSAINIKLFSMRGWTKGLRGVKFTLYQKGLKFAYL